MARQAQFGYHHGLPLKGVCPSIPSETFNNIECVSTELIRVNIDDFEVDVDHFEGLVIVSDESYFTRPVTSEGESSQRGLKFLSSAAFTKFLLATFYNSQLSERNASGHSNNQRKTWIPKWELVLKLSEFWY